MDYRKIFLYIVIIIAIAGFWYKSQLDEEVIAKSGDKFIQVYSSLAVLAELYRNEPDRYYQARDSVYSLYQFDGDSVTVFRETLEGTEDRWPDIWSKIRGRSDSLIEYFKSNPVDHPQPDSTDSL
ncbi:MAG: hypothetical protein KAR42_14325 [candidate division Zixibacteria bacterium]|nr:hypothetical protein [candidate division Zixibacteria bacterium]